MSARPRILLVAAANSTSGGGEKHIADLLRHVPRDTYDVGLALPPGGDLGTLAASLDVDIFDADIGAGFSAARLSQVRRAIESFGPDIVHAHGTRAALFARSVDRRAARRVVYTVHGIHTDRSPSAMRRTALLGTERLLRPRTARFITVCESDVRRGESLRILDASKTSVVYNGIELPQPSGVSGEFRAELGVSPDVPLVLCVGRFARQKDHATLVDAFARLRVTMPDAVLALVGSGALEQAVRDLSSQRGIADWVRFASPRPAIANAYMDADLVALSSLWEGLPYVVLEAMAHSKPVVATCVDGVPEAVDDGVSGLLVPPSDPDALALAMGKVLGDRGLARSLGEAGAVRVAQRFSLGRMVESLQKVYTEVLAT